MSPQDEMSRAEQDERYLHHGKGASAEVRLAVYLGEIQKPGSCERCGQWEKDPSNLHGHHEDYDKPLEVVWLCVRCHAEEHRATCRLNNDGKEEK